MIAILKSAPCECGDMLIWRRELVGSAQVVGVRNAYAVAVDHGDLSRAWIQVSES